MKKVFSVIIGLALICGASFAATSSKNVNTTADLIVDQIITNNNTINAIKVGSVIKTEISENATTGYTWKVVVGGDTKAVQVTFDQKEKSKDQGSAPAVVGAGVNKTLTIKGLKKGTATVKLMLSRDWEKNVQPLETRIYTIEVK